LDPCVYNIFDLASALKLNPEVSTLTPGISCTLYKLQNNLDSYFYCYFYMCRPKSSLNNRHGP